VGVRTSGDPSSGGQGPAALPRLACLMWFRGLDMAGLARIAPGGQMQVPGFALRLSAGASRHSGE